MKLLIKFIKNLKGYWKLEQDYGYEPDVYNFIIHQYSDVLCSRTKTMSKPTYYAKDIISEMDKWYEDRSEWYLETGEKFNDIINHYPLSEETLLKICKEFAEFHAVTSVDTIKDYLWLNYERKVPRLPWMNKKGY
jgi:hypothetical protein